MIYDWFFIFNSDDFDATGLTSKTYTVTLDGIGQVDILVTKANFTSILYAGEFLPIGLNDKNPFEFENFAVFKDETNQVWLGVNGRTS